MALRSRPFDVKAIQLWDALQPFVAHTLDLPCSELVPCQVSVLVPRPHPDHTIRISGTMGLQLELVSGPVVPYKKLVAAAGRQFQG